MRGVKGLEIPVERRWQIFGVEHFERAASLASDAQAFGSVCGSAKH